MTAFANEFDIQFFVGPGPFRSGCVLVTISQERCIQSLLIVLLLAGVLLLATGGLSYVAPFVYTLF